MNRLLSWLVVIVVAAGLCWLLPLFHVVPLAQAAKEKAAATFNPTEFADRFWNERLMQSLDKAVNVENLLRAIHANVADAKKKFSRSVGVSESYTYFVSGEGRVIATNEDEIQLAFSSGETSAAVSLQTGLIFGNAIPDGTGLLNVNDYPDSQEFNAVSEALNHLVETRVIPKLRNEAQIGGSIHFVGCAEVNDEATDLKPLKVVPIAAEAR